MEEVDQNAKLLDINDKKMNKIKLLMQISEKQIEYNNLLKDELDEVVVIAHAHGWRSSRVEQGQQMRKELDALKQRSIECKEEIAKAVEYIFENTKRIHGNSEALDWQRVAIYKSVSYILSLLDDIYFQEYKETPLKEQSLFMDILNDERDENS